MNKSHQSYSMTVEFGKLIWEKCAIGLAEVDLDGTWLAANPTLCALLEYTESELQGRTFQQLTHPEDIDDDVYMANKVKDGVLDYYTMSKRYITKTGQLVWIKLRVDPVKDEDGKVIFFLSQAMPAKHIPIDELSKNVESNKYGISKFIKSEWKWLISALVIVIGFSTAFMVERAVSLSKIERNTKDNEELKSEISDIKQKIDKILEKLPGK